MKADRSIDLLDPEHRDVGADPELEALAHGGRQAALSICREAKACGREPAAAQAQRETASRLEHLVQAGQFALVTLAGTGVDDLHALYTSPRLADIAGIDPQGDVYRQFLAMTHPEDLAALRDSFTHSAQTLQDFSCTVRQRHPQRGWRWFDLTVTPERPDPAGELLLHIMQRDVTRARETEELLRSFASHTSQGLMCFRRRDGGASELLFCNAAAERLLGLAHDGGDGGHAVSWRWPGLSQDGQGKLDQALAQALPFTIELERQRGAEPAVWIELAAAPQHELEGRVLWHLVIEDISVRKRTQDELATSERTLGSLLDHNPDAIIRFNRQLQRTFANASACELTGLPREWLLGLSLEQGSLMVDPARYERALRGVFDSGKASSLEAAYVRAGETEERTAHVRIVPEFDAQGRVETVLAVVRDISELAAAREELRRLASTDRLTGLPNRARMLDHLRESLQPLRRRSGREQALLLIDLDRFKDVNDTLGHRAGDRLLCEVSLRLQSCLPRSGDIVARLGGDEFVVLLGSLRSEGDAAVLADRILHSMRRPYRLDGTDVFVGASIGIAPIHGGNNDAEALLAQADAAMYAAKHRGRDSFAFYDPALTEQAQLRLRLGAGLHRAVQQGELELYYQPKVNIADGRVVGAEALLRWHHPERGLLAPDAFIGIAEDNGTIVQIGAWVVQETARRAARWNQGREGAPLVIALNLSPRQFQEGSLSQTVGTALREAGCHNTWIELEITENMMLNASPEVTLTLAEFAAMGLAVALDDFGTGHSALRTLNEFHLDVLKIDRSFVAGAAANPQRAALVRAFIGIARELGMSVVAEGVETAEDAGFLQQSGCELAQGWLYGMAVPAAEFERVHLGG